MQTVALISIIFNTFVTYDNLLELNNKIRPVYIFLICRLSYHKILIPIGPDAKEISPDLEFRNQITVSAVKFCKKLFAVYDTNDPIGEILQP